MLLAIASFIVLAASPTPVAAGPAPPVVHVSPRRPHKRRVRISADVLQRDVVRMTRLAQLEGRHALLSDFLIRARTETPLLRDDAVHEPAPGIRLSATVVSQDFEGNPVIRARVTSTRAQAIYLVLTADTTDVGGAHARASTALVIAPGASQVVELACPVRQSPTQVRWSAEAL